MRPDSIAQRASPFPLPQWGEGTVRRPLAASRRGLDFPLAKGARELFSAPWPHRAEDQPFPLSLRERAGVREQGLENFRELINVARIVDKRLGHRAIPLGIQLHFAQLAHTGFGFGRRAFD